MEKPNLDILGRNLQTLRLAKGLSLSQLANNAGIAKSNLSRIEQGDGNPTIETIWRLAVQLNVPFGDLIARVPASLGENGIQVKLIDQGNDNPRVDVYWMSCAPNTRKLSEAHISGTTESITMISGELYAGEEDHMHVLRAGDTFSFAADKPHRYETGDLWSTLIMVITYPKQEQSI